MALSRGAWKEARETIITLLNVDNPTLRDDQNLRSSALVPLEDVTMHLPASIGVLIINILAQIYIYFIMMY